MKRTGAIVLLTVFVAAVTLISSTRDAMGAEFDLYGQVQSFIWEEVDDSGVELLEESGPIFGLGAAVRGNVDSLTLNSRGEFFAGGIDYDGQTQTGVRSRSNTNYIGGKVEGDIGWKVMMDESSSVEPFAGLGYRWWKRDINDTDMAFGIVENWSSSYARFGVRGDNSFSDDTTIFAEGSLKIAVKNENEADLTRFGLPEVSLEPGKSSSVFASLGIKWKHLKVSAFYESLRFSESDPVDLVLPGMGILRVWQPKSEADIVGLNAGAAF